MEPNNLLQEKFYKIFQSNGFCAEFSSIEALSEHVLFEPGPLNVDLAVFEAFKLAISTLLPNNSAENDRISWGISENQLPSYFNSLNLTSLDGQVSEGFSEFSKFFKTQNGWVRTHANYPHHKERLLAAFPVDSSEELASQIRSSDTNTVLSKARQHSALVEPVLTREEWLNTSLGSSTKKNPLFKIHLNTSTNTKELNSAATASSAQAGEDLLPLRGLKVLDFTRVIAGPTTSRLLALLGADVLRIDPPDYPELQNHFIDTGFGKRSLVTDFTKWEETAELRTLIENADVLLIGYRGTSTLNQAVASDVLRERFPHLITIQLTAWGTGEEGINKPGFDSLVQATSGIADLYSTEEGSPGALPIQALDHIAGLVMAAMIGALLQYRKAYGVGGNGEISLTDISNLLFEYPQEKGARSNALPNIKPLFSRMNSSYGEIMYPLPPIEYDHNLLDYPSPPPPYGSDEPQWLG